MALCGCSGCVFAVACCFAAPHCVLAFIPPHRAVCVRKREGVQPQYHVCLSVALLGVAEQGVWGCGLCGAGLSPLCVGGVLRDPCMFVRVLW